MKTTKLNTVLFYEQLKPVLDEVRQTISEARASQCRIRELRVNGNIQFNIAGKVVATYMGSEGTEINLEWLSYWPFDFKRKFGLI